VILVHRLKSKAKSGKPRPKFTPEYLLPQHLVSKVQQGLLYYNLGITVFELQYGEKLPLDMCISTIWPIFVLQGLITSAPKRSLFEVAIAIIVDISFLIITPIPLPKIFLIISCDLCLCVKCLVLWRFVACASQKKDAEESSNAENDAENPSQGKLLESITSSHPQLAAVEDLIDQPQKVWTPEIESSKRKPSEARSDVSQCRVLLSPNKNNELPQCDPITEAKNNANV
jgi:hypothetical protein